MTDLFDLLRQLERERFYGSLEVRFEAGHITVIRKTESIKPGTGDQRNNRGYANEHTTER